MSTHFSSFTPEGMTRLADMLRADEDNRREFCTSNRQQTQQLMGQFHSERQAAGSLRARERSQFLDELRAGGQRFRAQCAATGRERAGQLRDLACQYRAAADAFHGARRARRA